MKGHCRMNGGVIILVFMAAHSLQAQVVSPEISKPPPSISEELIRIDGIVQRLEKGDQKRRKAAHEELQIAIWNEYRGDFPDAIRARVSGQLIRLYRNSPDEDILADIAVFGNDDLAKPFLHQVLATGTNGEQRIVSDNIGLNVLLRNDFYGQVKDMVLKERDRHGCVSLSNLNRIDRQKALKDIIANSKSCTSALPIIEVSPELRGKYLDAVTGVPLKAALDFLARPDTFFVRDMMIPALTRRLGSPDPQVRILSAQALVNAATQIKVGQKSYESHASTLTVLERKNMEAASRNGASILTSLRAALKRESITEVQKALQAALQSITGDEGAAAGSKK